MGSDKLILLLKNMKMAKIEVYSISSKKLGRTNLFNGTLPEASKAIAPSLDVWNKLSQNEINIHKLHMPNNPFDELVLATEKGRLWHYPIDNEQGLKQDESFHEHVFLDHFLEGFPSSGPIRNFMELVISGLASNPYMTVSRKHEIINWYRRYFDGKKDIYKSSGLEW